MARKKQDSETEIKANVFSPEEATRKNIPESGNVDYINFKTVPYEASVTLPAGYYAAGYSFINTATGQESQPVLLGNVGPVTFAVSDGGAGKKKAA